jgi:hypothetical protein
VATAPDAPGSKPVGGDAQGSAHLAARDPLFPMMGTCYALAMYVVGANLLRDHWRDHPEAEGELRALHALLVAGDAGTIREKLGRIAEFDAGGAALRLRNTRVRIEINQAAGIARYAAVIAAEEEEA